MENRVTLKIKLKYYLELLSPETMKLLQKLEITDVVLAHFNLVNNTH